MYHVKIWGKRIPGKENTEEMWREVLIYLTLESGMEKVDYSFVFTYVGIVWLCYNENVFYN